MTGTGAHLYASGDFAFGNPTTNMVFDGVNVYLNGFAELSSSTNTFLSITEYPKEYSSFTITKTAQVVYGVTATIFYSTIDVGTISLSWAYNLALSKRLNASEMQAGFSYWIRSIGTTNFVSYGAPSNTVGEQFTATGAGTGTGTVYSTTYTSFTNKSLFSFIPYQVNSGLWNRAVAVDTAYTDTKLLAPGIYDFIVWTVNITYYNASGAIYTPPGGTYMQKYIGSAVAYTYAARI
jgi:hypothetical protein